MKINCQHKNSVELYKYHKSRIMKCKDCGLVFNNRNKHFVPEDLYKDYYKETGGRFSLVFEFFIKLFRFWRAIKIYFINKKAKSILDIGSGRGYMLYYLKKYFFFNVAIGTQISEPAYKFSKDQLGLDIYNKDLLDIDFEEKKFDIVTLWHVLEHVEEPEKYLEKIYRILNKNGRIVLEVPNYNSWTRKICGKFWLALDVEHHLYYFTPVTLSKMLNEAGFLIKNNNSFSFEYSTFTSVQSLVSYFTKTNHMLFSSLQKKTNMKISFLHIVLFILLLPVCFLINILLYFSEYGENIFIVAEKNVKR